MALEALKEFLSDELEASVEVDVTRQDTNTIFLASALNKIRKDGRLSSRERTAVAGRIEILEDALGDSGFKQTDPPLSAIKKDARQLGIRA